jgi:hypothetical protein
MNAETRNAFHEKNPVIGGLAALTYISSVGQTGFGKPKIDCRPQIPAKLIKNIREKKT